MATTVQTPARAAIEGRQQLAWSSGDFARIGNSLVIIGELLCEAADLSSGQRVLDVASSSRNAAHAAAPERLTEPDQLTRREQQVVAQIALGKGNREIADALFIAEKTVEMHVTNSLSKLGFH